MAKDPAFLFYSQDWIVGTQFLTMQERGQYITLLASMHQHGRLDSERVGLLVGSVSVTLKNKFKIDEEGCWYNEKLESERGKRQQFVDKQVNNGKKGGRPKNPEITQPLTQLKPNIIPKNNPTEDENENINSIINSIEQLQKNKIPLDQKKYFMYLVVEMAKIFTSKVPTYFFHQETDYHACLDIAYNIADLKKWKKDQVVNGKMNDCLESWKTIVDFIKDDDWLNKRSLSDIATIKEWQRLVLKMNSVKKSPPKKSIIL